LNDEPGRLTIRSVTGAEYPVVLSVREAAEILGVHEDTAWRMCQAGTLPTLTRIGTGQYRIITARLLADLGLLPAAAVP
jgi:excisionase family DNA binding protein